MENLELNKVYNMDCLDLMREMVRGGGNGRLANSRSTIRH